MESVDSAGTETVTRAARLDSLTGIRSIAALAVVGYHLQVVPTRSGQPVFSLAQFGFVGVGLFYILSGFVLSWTWRPAQRSIRFYWLRFARVYPIYVLALLGAAAVDAVQGDVVEGGPLFASVFLVQSWIPDVGYFFGVQPVFWSLSVEAFFYAMFPLIMPRIAGRSIGHRRWIGLGCFAALIAFSVASLSYDGTTVWLVYIFPLARLPEFVIGILLAIEVRDRTAPRINVWVATAAVVGAYALLWVVPESFRPASTMVIFFAALLVAVASADLDSTGSPYRGKLMVRIGVWSYALYLVHTSLLGFLDRAFPEPEWWSDILFVVFACLVSGAIYAAIERPVERRLRRINIGETS